MLSRSLIVPAALLISCTFLAIAAQPEHRGHHTPASSVPKQPQPVNDRCPIRGAEVDPETPQRMWKGHAIGFCCPGCDTKWDAKADAEKDAFLARYVKSEPATRPSRSRSVSTKPAPRATSRRWTGFFLGMRGQPSFSTGPMPVPGSGTASSTSSPNSRARPMRSGGP